MKPHCEARSQEASQSSEGTDVAAFFFFFFYEAMDKCNRTLMGLLKKKHSSIKFNYPRMLRMKKKRFSVKEV